MLQAAVQPVAPVSEEVGAEAICPSVSTRASVLSATADVRVGTGAPAPVAGTREELQPANRPGSTVIAASTHNTNKKKTLQTSQTRTTPFSHPISSSTTTLGSQIGLYPP